MINNKIKKKDLTKIRENFTFISTVQKLNRKLLLTFIGHLVAKAGSKNVYNENVEYFLGLLNNNNIELEKRLKEIDEILYIKGNYEQD